MRRAVRVEQDRDARRPRAPRLGDVLAPRSRPRRRDSEPGVVVLGAREEQLADRRHAGVRPARRERPADVERLLGGAAMQRTRTAWRW